MGLKWFRNTKKDQSSSKLSNSSIIVQKYFKLKKFRSSSKILFLEFTKIQNSSKNKKMPTNCFRTHLMFSAYPRNTNSIFSFDTAFQRPIQTVLVPVSYYPKHIFI